MSNYLTMSNKYYDTALNLVKEAGEVRIALLLQFTNDKNVYTYIVMNL